LNAPIHSFGRLLSCWEIGGKPLGNTRKYKKLPVVLSKEEVAKIINSVDNLKHKAIRMFVYSAGLRVGEVVGLRAEDIDSNRMLIHIKGGKGISTKGIGKIKSPRDTLDLKEWDDK
jgi:integrase